MGWDGRMGWDGMGWGGMGWKRMGFVLFCFVINALARYTNLCWWLPSFTYLYPLALLNAKENKTNRNLALSHLLLFGLLLFMPLGFYVLLGFTGYCLYNSPLCCLYEIAMQGQCSSKARDKHCSAY